MLKKSVVGLIVALSVVLNMSFMPVLAAQQKSSEETGSESVAKVMDASNVFDFKAKASVLMDGVSGSVLMEKNSHERLPIASVTKVMSMLLIMEAVDTVEPEEEGDHPALEAGGRICGADELVVVEAPVREAHGAPGVDPDPGPEWKAGSQNQGVEQVAFQAEVVRHRSVVVGAGQR